MLNTVGALVKRRKYNQKEEDLLQKTKRENQKLKRQITALRKQLQRVDLERYENLKDLIYKNSKEDIEDKIKKEREKLKKDWECHTCRVGFMKIHTISRRDGLFYYRKCTKCDNRTPTKPYNEKVEGIKNGE